MKPGLCILLLFTLLQALPLGAEKYSSQYVGEEQRKIKSLSADDIAQLKKGGGWGLAKAAELNGVPGPAHVLDMGDKIHLTGEQTAAIQKIFAAMHTAAMLLGEQLIQGEVALNNAFASNSVDQASLQTMVRNIERVRAELRIAHLSAHLQTAKILGQEQIALYNRLRGYSQSEDPCQKVPAGHDAAMWKKHHGCN